MHVVFMAHGILSAVEHLKIDMQAQKFQLPMRKKGEKDMFIWMQGRLSVGPFGVWEYSFPKEAIDLILTTLCGVNGKGDYSEKIGSSRMFILRKMMGCEKLPKFNNKDKLLWIRENVGIIPIGVRYDEELTEPKTSGEYAGWTHEGI